MIRVAAVGDVHFARDMRGVLRPHLDDVADVADLLLLAGDLTTCGDPDEAAALAGELEGVGVPVIAVLGNHDHHVDQDHLVRKRLDESGVQVLDGETTTLQVDGSHVGIAGTKGFGVGSRGRAAPTSASPR